MEPTPIRENEVYCKRKKFINETLELLERKRDIFSVNFSVWYFSGQIDEEKAADKERKKRARSRARQLHKKLASRDQSAHEDRTKRLIEQEKQREEVSFSLYHMLHGPHCMVYIIWSISYSLYVP